VKNYEQTFPNKEHKQSLPSHAHSCATSADSIPPGSL